MNLDADLSIREATAADMKAVEQVLGVERAHFYRDRLRRDGAVLAGWLADSPVAGVYLSWEPAEEPELRLHLAGVPVLHRLYVRQDRRNRGVGTALLKAAESVLYRRGHDRVASGVDADNPRIAAFYRRRDYAEWGHGEIPTIRERYGPGGAITREPDRCRIFVKHLDMFRQH